MKRNRLLGFTLIELLTVIAIIGILTAITFAVLPRMLERAKITSLRSTMDQFRLMQTDYLAQNNTYVPGYGFVKFEQREKLPPPTTDADVYYHLEPWTATLRVHRSEDYADPFADNFDTDGDGIISLLEFLPLGTPDATRGYTFPDELYSVGDGAFAGEITMQIESEGRPFVYVPVNLRQYERAKDYWIKSGDFYGSTWEVAPSNDLADIYFPPEKYDAYALISMGPGGNTFGVVANPPTGNYAPEHVYHVAALRTFFLASRDLNNNMQLDFDFETRGNGEGNQTSYPITVEGNTVTVPDGNMLPPRVGTSPETDNPARNGYGPMIYIVGK